LTVFARIWYGQLDLWATRTPVGRPRKSYRVPDHLPAHSPSDVVLPRPTEGRLSRGRAWLDDEFDPYWYARAILRRWPFVAAATVAGALAALAYASSRPVLYEAATTLMIAYPTAVRADMTPQAFVPIIKNASLAAQVVDDIKRASPATALTPQALLNAVTVDAVVATNVLTVRVRLPEAGEAAEASRRLSQKAIELTRSLSEGKGIAVQEQLKQHLDAAAKRLAAAEEDMLAFQQQAQVDVLKEDTQAMLQERGDLLKLVIAIESEKARLAAAEQEIQRQEPVLSAGAGGTNTALKLAAGAGLGQPPPPVMPGEARVPTTPDRLDPTDPLVNPVYQMLGFQIATSRTRLAALEQERRQVVEVRKLGSEGFSRLSELYRRQIDLARKQTSVELAKRVHSELAVRYEESRTRALGDAPQLQLVDAAIRPEQPVSRGRGRLMVVGGLTGLLAMSLVALSLEGWIRVAPDR
jgi:hypothetical protein